MHARSFFRYFPVAVFGLLAALIGMTMAAPASDTSAARGARLFTGKEAIKGTIPGHEHALPPQLSRCVNCHAPAKKSADEKFAPLLNRDALLQSRVRRGGPSFAYTSDSFCKTLRTGIDPEYVILSRVMPRFDASPEQCAALWAYLMQVPNDEKK